MPALEDTVTPPARPTPFKTLNPRASRPSNVPKTSVREGSAGPKMKMGTKGKELAATAHHEAGHAVIASRQRVAFGAVTIVPNDVSLGLVRTPVTPAFLNAAEVGELPASRLESHVLVCLAGREAEMLFCGRYNDLGARSDHECAVMLLERHVGSDEELEAWLRLLEIRSRRAVKDAWEEIKVVAMALFERRTLSARQTRDCIRQVGRERSAARRAEIFRGSGITAWPVIEAE